MTPFLFEIKSKSNVSLLWWLREPQLLNLDKIFGFILNVPNKSSDGFLSTPLNYIPARAQIWSSQKHWIAIRKIASLYYNLDSKLAAPFCIGEVSYPAESELLVLPHVLILTNMFLTGEGSSALFEHEKLSGTGGNFHRGAEKCG